MSGVVSAFVSDHETVLTWKAAMDSERMSWGSVMRHFEEQWPDHQIYGRNQAFGLGREVVGLDGNESPGEGWRFHKRLGLWVPDKRTKLGKGYAKDLEALQLKIEPIPGMPMTAVENSKWHHPGIEQLDGSVWVTWSCSADTVRAAEWSNVPPDDAFWREAPLSSYYLAKEAAA